MKKSARDIGDLVDMHVTLNKHIAVMEKQRQGIDQRILSACPIQVGDLAETGGKQFIVTEVFGWGRNALNPDKPVFYKVWVVPWRPDPIPDQPDRYIAFIFPDLEVAGVWKVADVWKLE